MAFKVEKIGNEKIEIEVTQAGTFAADFDEMSYTAKTYAELVEQLKKAVGRYKKGVAVAVTILGIEAKPKGRYPLAPADKYEPGIGVVHARLRGEHSRNRTLLLATDPEGDKFQLSEWLRDAILCRRLEPAVVEEWFAIKRAAVKAAEALKAFEELHAVTLAELRLELKGGDA